MTLLIKESSLDAVATLLSDMSVTSCEGMNSLGSGESRYDPPDAPLSNAATRSARHYKDCSGPLPRSPFCYMVVTNPSHGRATWHTTLPSPQ